MNRRLAIPLLRWGNRITRKIVPPTAASFRILLFHDVPPGQSAGFERIVARLAKEDRLLAPGEPAGRRNPFLLTFDDGFASNYEIAAGILARYGARAIFFVCPGLIDAEGAARRELVAKGLFGSHPEPARAAAEARLMDWDMLERLRAAGHAVGNHTMHHKRLTRISQGERATEIGEAAERLRRRLGETRWFAYTFGDIDSIDSETMQEISRHHTICRSGVRGANDPSVAPLALRADNIDLATAPDWQDLVLEGALDPLYHSQRRRLDAMLPR